MTATPDTPEGETGRISPWASLQFRDFRLLFVSGFFSATAREMRMVVNFYLIFELSDSAVLLGLTGLFQAIPLVFVGLAGGAMADLFDRRKILLFARFMSLIPALSLGFLTLTGAIEVWHIFVAVGVTSAVGSLEPPAQMSYTTRVVPRSHLLNAIALNSTLTQTAFFIGPVMLGFAGLFNIETAYFINAGLYIPSILALLLLGTSGVPEGPRQKMSLSVIGEGFRFVWMQRVLFATFALDFGVVMVGFFRPLLTILAKDVYEVGPAGLGLLNGAPAVGSVLGSGTVLLMGRVHRGGVLFLVSVFLYGASLVALGLSPWYWMGLLAAGALGYTDSISVVIRSNLTQVLAPDRLRGRASSFTMVTAELGNALGSMEAGFVAGLIGVANTLTFGGVAAMGVVIAGGLAWRELWRFRQEADP
jgi:MFS family permease